MTNNYSPENIATMEMIYGEGYLSAGGDAEVAAVVQGIDLASCDVLDLGCGLGGASITLARDLGAESLVGADIDDAVLARAAELVEKHSLKDRICLTKIDPGPLEFENNKFDLVYLTAVTCHIDNLIPFFEEVCRVLKPGGVIAGCEWLKLADNDAYRQWDDLLRERGLNFSFVDQNHFLTSLQDAGFQNGSVTDRTEVIADLSKNAVDRVQGELKDDLIKILGDEGYGVCLDWTRTRSQAYQAGGIGQGHFRGFKPE